MSLRPAVSRWSVADDRNGDETFNVVAICQANLCRSPLMEFLLREEAQSRHLNWVVTSAGTEAVPGLPIHPHSAELLAARGVDTSGWLTRSLDLTVIADAHLVLTATQDQRETVAALDPRLAGSVFPLLQFAHLARVAHSGRPLTAIELGPWLLQESYRRRKRLDQFPDPDRDLFDPIGRPLNRFRQCAEAITAAYANILSWGPPARRS